jgi:protein phosphatase 1L
MYKDSEKSPGSTATGAFLVGSRLTVFNIGDCQAVMRREQLTHLVLAPHKPNREDETARILEANGWITEERELFMGRLHRMDLTDERVVEEARKVTWVTNYRVCGELAVSRSIGDPYYKAYTWGEVAENLYLAWPQGHTRIFHGDIVIPNPECVTIDINKNDEFLIIASDGLWDVVTGDDATSFVQTCLMSNKTAAEVAKELCELALRLGSGDNVTCIIVLFVHENELENSHNRSKSLL